MIDKAFFELNPTRSVIAIAGEDRAGFLQGLISNDTRRIGDSSAIYAALLTPQGKFAYDLLLVGDGDRYLVDAESSRRADLLKRLKLFKLRSKVTLEDLDDTFLVVNIFGDGVLQRLGLADTLGTARALAGGLVFADPRLAALGARAFLPRGTAAQALLDLGFAAAAPGDFQRLRFSLGVPEGSHDLIPDKSILLESGVDELHGVDWQKGCYMGQELTARTKYRGLVRKRLLPVRIVGPALAPGTVLTIDGKEAGEIRIADSDRGLALIRLEHLDAMTGSGADADGAHVTASVPDWVKLPEMA
ncbi:folate-binding protein YgfZ [Dongia mobilis]|uniref:CAF17-like 4Fe-4S cluster assembly/insertion protein YgfZ n=1 Tax=Dongia sp. TaxID=1977262 RepID=UPI0026EFEE33